MGKIENSVAGTVVLVCGLLGLAQAGAQEDAKIGFVNVVQLLEQAPHTRAMMESLQEEFAPREREIVALQQSLQGKAETLQRDGAVMGEEERTNLERDIRNEQRSYEREVSEYQEDFDIRRNEELAELQRFLAVEIRSFASSAGYDLILSQQGVVFASNAVSITEAVLQRLEEDYSSSTGP